MRYFLLILATIFVGFILFIGYHVVDEYQRNALRDHLTSEMIAMHQEEITCCIEMREITNFAWDKMYVFGSYPVPSYIEEKLGFEWNHAREIANYGHDSSFFLIFVKGSQVVEYVEFSGWPLFESYEFSEFTPDEAIFRVAPPPR